MISHSLQCRHLQPIELAPNWVEREYSIPRNPFVIDVGCSKGYWALRYGAAHPNVNVLGIDIRQPVIDVALEKRKALNLGNVHFLKSNANVDINKIISSIQCSVSAGVELIAIQFPDPYFRENHHKRRLLNTQFIRSLINGGVDEGTRLFVQTDVEELMNAMTEVLEQNSDLVSLTPGQSYDDTLFNPVPFDVPTEREISCRKNGNVKIHKVMVQTKRSRFT